MENKDLRKNGSGYKDITAFAAIKNISDEGKKVSTLIKSIKTIITLCGYDCIDHIVIKNRKSGKVWR